MKLIDIMTISEAAKEWGLDVSTLRYACIKDKFTDKEARKSEGTWLITRRGMKRVYGEPPLAATYKEEK
jgi:hypothetical protein